MLDLAGVVVATSVIAPKLREMADKLNDAIRREMEKTDPEMAEQLSKAKLSTVLDIRGIIWRSLKYHDDLSRYQNFGQLMEKRHKDIGIVCTREGIQFDDVSVRLLLNIGPYRLGESVKSAPELTELTPGEYVLFEAPAGGGCFQTSRLTKARMSILKELGGT